VRTSLMPAREIVVDKMLGQDAVQEIGKFNFQTV
jgi:hypothetical protein